jgi:hypothetical protein
MARPPFILSAKPASFMVGTWNNERIPAVAFINEIFNQLT